MEKKEKFIYCLRYAIQPGFHEDDKLKVLVDFCRNAFIDDVMFFINCEELNQGHLTVDETIPWLELISKAKSTLEPMGITTSINPWTTLLHCDRGRMLKKGQNFNLMVDPYGQSATAVACPLCPEWRKYIAQMYSLYASIKPAVLWVEDDFRLHNHEPLEYGGCFCDMHMKEYSKKAGKKLSREDFAEGVLKPGNPHPYRKIYLDASRDCMVEIAGIIGDAVHKVSPGTRIGLMSSNPSVHCAEGRDWKGIFKGFNGEMPGINRIHLPSYGENASNSDLLGFNTVSNLARAVIPEQTIILPELENFPQTRFSKSIAFSRYQIDTSLILGSDGITMNLFDMMGNGVIDGEAWKEMLTGEKEFLSCIKALGIRKGTQSGIKVLVNTESSYTLHTVSGTKMRELYPKESFWAGVLSSYGIAYAYSLDRVHNNSILAVSGQYFRNLSGSEIINLFENNFIIMEGEAADTLFDMGYGHLAGISGTAWHYQNSGFQAYEQVCDGNNYYSLKDARISCQCYAGDFLEIKYGEKPLLKSVIKSPDGNTVAPGMSLHNNRVLILPYGMFNNGFSSHLNPVRQEMVQKTLMDATGLRCPVFVKDSPYVAVYEYQLKNRKLLILLNASRDDYSQLKIYAKDWRSKDILEIGRAAKKPVNANIEWDNDTMILKNGLASLELKVLITENIN